MSSAAELGNPFLGGDAQPPLVRGREGGNQAVAHGSNPRLGIGFGLLANRVFDEIHDSVNVIDGLPMKGALERRQLNVKDALPIHDGQRLPGPAARLHGRELRDCGEEEVIQDPVSRSVT